MLGATIRTIGTLTTAVTKFAAPGAITSKTPSRTPGRTPATSNSPTP
jgi:hypothetical protein